MNKQQQGPFSVSWRWQMTQGFQFSRFGWGEVPDELSKVRSRRGGGKYRNGLWTSRRLSPHSPNTQGGFSAAEPLSLRRADRGQLIPSARPYQSLLPLFALTSSPRPSTSHSHPASALVGSVVSVELLYIQVRVLGAHESSNRAIPHA
jgi:hypothetical protein